MAVYVPLEGGLANCLFRVAAGYIAADGDTYSLSVPHSRSTEACWEKLFAHWVKNDCASPVDARNVYDVELAIDYDGRHLRRTSAHSELIGYYQNWLYFIHRLDLFLTFISLCIVEQKEKIKAPPKKMCAIHIRGGDYELYPGQHPMIGTTNYYEKAVALLPADCQLVVFTNDTVHASDVGKTFGRPYIWVNEVIADLTDADELYFMSLFPYIIIANSSFSLFAAYMATFINESPSMVIAPDVWFGDDPPAVQQKSRLPPTWTVVECTKREKKK